MVYTKQYYSFSIGHRHTRTPKGEVRTGKTHIKPFIVVISGDGWREIRFMAVVIATLVLLVRFYKKRSYIIVLSFFG